MNQPEKKFAHGAYRATIFANTVNINGHQATIKKVVITKRYKDKSGEWKNSSSLDINDVPKMITALMTAYAYLTQNSNSTNGQDNQTGTDMESI